METNASLIEPLLGRIQEYGKTSFELLKLQSLEKTVDVASTFLSRSLTVIFISLFALTLNIGVALWLGDLLGKNYYGFLAVAALYGIIGVILFFIHPSICGRISNSIIAQLRK